MDTAQKKWVGLLAVGCLVAGGGLACLAAAGLLVLGRSGSTAPLPAPAGGPQPATQAAPATTAPRPGRISGRIAGADGQPVRVAGHRVRVQVGGVTGRGENVAFSPPVGPDGAYELEVPSGIYHGVRAELEVPFQGKAFVLELEPVQDNTVDRRSDEGIVQDFVWRVSGPRPGRVPDPNNHTHWYGASIGLSFEFYRNDLKKPVPGPPPGTRATFRLEPRGPLVDGSAGSILVFERSWDPSGQALLDKNLPDLPLGTYLLSAVETRPDGTQRPLLIQKAFAEFVPSLEVSFQPKSFGGVEVPIIGFTRTE